MFNLGLIKNKKEKAVDMFPAVTLLARNEEGSKKMSGFQLNDLAVEALQLDRETLENTRVGICPNYAGYDVVVANTQLVQDYKTVKGTLTTNVVSSKNTFYNQNSYDILVEAFSLDDSKNNVLVLDKVVDGDGYVYTLAQAIVDNSGIVIGSMNQTQVTTSAGTVELNNGEQLSLFQLIAATETLKAMDGEDGKLEFEVEDFIAEALGQ